MLKDFASHSLLYITGTVVSRGIGILLVPVYTRLMEPSYYGTLDLSQLFISLATIVFSLEISQAIARFYSDAQNELEKRRLTFSGLVLVVSFSLVLTVFLFVFKNTFSSILFGNDGYDRIFQWGLGTAVANVVYYYTQTQLRWDCKPLHFSVASVLYSLISASVSILLVTRFEWKVEGVLLGQICGSVVGATYAIASNIRRYKPAFNTASLKGMLAFSLPLVPSSILVIMSTYADRITIQRMLGIGSMGVYSVAMKLSGIVALVFFGLNSALTPLIYRHFKEEDTPIKIAKIATHFARFSALIWIVAGLFSSNIISVAAGFEYSGAAKVFPLLVVSSTLLSFSNFIPGLAIVKRTKLIAFISLLSAVVIVAMNLLLVPILGVIGAAISNFCSSLVSLSLYYILGYRHYKIPFELKKIGRAVGCGAVCVTCGYISAALNFESYMKLPFISILFVIAVLVLRKDLIESVKAFTSSFRIARS